MIRTHRIGSIVFLDGLNLTSPDNIVQMVWFRSIYIHDYYELQLKF